MWSRSTTIWPSATPNGWGQVYRFLGMTTGVIIHGLNDEERKAAYAADVTYGTNNEFGFDYLRDNMKYELDQMVQRGHSTLPSSMRSTPFWSMKRVHR